MKSDIARHGTVRPSVHPITRAQWMMMARMQTFPQKGCIIFYPFYRLFLVYWGRTLATRVRRFSPEHEHTAYTDTYEPPA